MEQNISKFYLLTIQKILNSEFFLFNYQINNYNGGCSSTVLEYVPVAHETRVRLPPSAFNLFEMDEIKKEEVFKILN